MRLGGFVSRAPRRDAGIHRSDETAIPATSVQALQLSRMGLVGLSCQHVASDQAPLPLGITGPSVPIPSPCIEDHHCGGVTARR